MRRIPPLLALLLALGAAGAAAQGPGSCPVQYGATGPAGLLMGGVLHAASCTNYTGKHCPINEKNRVWARECAFPTSSTAFGVCSEEGRAAGLRIAQQLHGGAPLRLSPCDLWPYLRNRTLWLIGDSHTKQLFKALTCFMFDFWDGRDCAVTEDAGDARDLDALPKMPGETKCINVLGSGRVCRVGAVLGSSLVDNPQLPSRGVLNMLRRKHAHPNDIFVIQFGLWHLLEGTPGLDRFKEAVEALGKDYHHNRGRWPHMIWRETPMKHDKGYDSRRCKRADSGWIFDGATGQLAVLPNARSDAAALLVRGGKLNAPAREILGRYKMPVMGGFSYSVPLHLQHPAMRGTKELDCIHYCHYGLPELLVYELTRVFRNGTAGIAPISAALNKWRPCPAFNHTY